MNYQISFSSLVVILEQDIFSNNLEIHFPFRIIIVFGVIKLAGATLAYTEKSLTKVRSIANDFSQIMEICELHKTFIEVFAEVTSSTTVHLNLPYERILCLYNFIISTFTTCMLKFMFSWWR